MLFSISFVVYKLLIYSAFTFYLHAFTFATLFLLTIDDCFKKQKLFPLIISHCFSTMSSFNKGKLLKIFGKSIKINIFFVSLTYEK